MQKTIFVVDDNDTNLTMAEEALENEYNVITLPSAKRLYAMLGRMTPDLILLDVEMEDIDGFEALKYLKETPKTSEIPVIFLTGNKNEETETNGFRMGAVDFITKPFSVPVLRNRIKTHLDIDSIIRSRTEQLQRLQSSIVFVLADMIESRDMITGGHVERTSAYLRVLVEALIKRGLYTKEFSNIDVNLLIDSARLHDVGKISVPDAILNKPGKLTDEEFEKIKKHASEGERIILEIMMKTGADSFLEHAKYFAGYHHERWDGRGYPYGIAGEEIPLQGRIMIFADVYDALVMERPYKKPFSHEEAVKIILDGTGTQFDPNIAVVFSEIHEEFRKINTNYALEAVAKAL